MRYAGYGWPNGPEPHGILHTPGSCVIILDSEARWHWNRLAALRPDILRIWRSTATSPNSVQYNAQRYCDYVVKHWPEQSHDPHEFLVAGNEFNLNYERGDAQDDWNPDVLRWVYSTYADFLERVRWELTARLPDVTHVYPAWAPGHYLREMSELWAPAAENWPVISFHAYGTPEQIEDEFRWYRARFPEKPLLLTEWNSGDHVPPADRPGNERAVLARLARLVRDDSLFYGACYFIWKWHSGHGSHANWDIQDNPERLALFLNPPQPEETELPKVQPPEGEV